MSVRDWLKHSAFGEILIRRCPPFYSGFRGLLADMDTAGLEQRRAMSDAYLTRALETAGRTVYARSMKVAGNFDDWPVLEKATLRDRFADLTLVHPSAASATTGGTTGIPLRVRRSWRSVIFEQAVIDHLTSKAGVVWRRARIAILRGDSIKASGDMSAPFWSFRHNGRHLVMSSNHLNTQTAQHYAQALESFRPDILWVYPTSLAALCGHLAGRLNLPSLKLVASSSEVLSADDRERAGKLLAAPICDFYGQAERVCASWSFDGKSHYFLPAYGKVELAFSHGDGEFDYYEIIGTPFWNTAQPLVRYRTEDFAKLQKGASGDTVDAICHGAHPFAGISGRQSEFLVSPEGVRLVGMNFIPRGIPHVIQMQVHQPNLQTVEIHLVPAPGYSAEIKDRILRNARSKIPQSMQIRIKPVEQLYRTPNGKAPLVVRTF
ncbi:MAG: hypothetical protein L0H37_10745 [Nitrosospira sp.]|nr:hypothetical protein [Nitrosospira sp.]